MNPRAFFHRFCEIVDMSRTSCWLVGFASASEPPPTQGFLRKEPDELQVHRGSLNTFSG